MHRVVTIYISNQQKMNKNIHFLADQVRKTSQNIDDVSMRTIMLEQSILFETELNQYIYQTQSLISIINSAIHGKIHTTVFPAAKLLLELRVIQLILPSGTQHPISVSTQDIPEFFKLASATIFYKDNFLIFLLNFPIAKIDEYVLYHPIPIPFFLENNNIILVAPENDYVAFNDVDDGFYLILSYKQKEACIQLKLYTLCTNDQSIHHRSSSKSCEVTLFQNP